jgi:hypothetical protein
MSQQLSAKGTINLDQQAITRATTLIGKGQAALAKTRSGSNGYITGPDYLDGESFYGWRTQVLSFLVGLLDEDHVYVKGFKDHCQEAYPSNAQAGIGILASLLEDLQNGYLQTLQELVHANTFADFLEMAEHLLLDGGYKDAAAVMVGSTLEAHLRNLATKKGISTERQSSRGLVPKNADTMNAELAGAGVYTKLDQKSVTSWLDLRNNAAHGKYAAYTDTQVTMMIQAVRDFISRNPA